VRRAPARLVLRRADFEIRRLIGGDRLGRPRTFSLPGGTRVTACLDDCVGRSLYIYGTYEWASARLLEDLLHPGGVFVDVGAHVGSLALPAARRVGPEGLVVAFEPNGRAREQLVSGVRASRVANVVVLGVGLADRDLRAVLRPGGDGNSGMTRLIEAGGPAGRGRSGGGVECRTLDGIRPEIALPPVDVLKVDVEGWEARVLQGARGLIADDRPAVVFEVNGLRADGGSWHSPAMDWLHEEGYALFGMGPGGAAALRRLWPGEDPRPFEEPWLALNLVAFHPDRPLASFADADRRVLRAAAS